MSRLVAEGQAGGSGLLAVDDGASLLVALHEGANEDAEGFLALLVEELLLGGSQVRGDVSRGGLDLVGELENSTVDALVDRAGDAALGQREDDRSGTGEGADVGHLGIAADEVAGLDRQLQFGGGLMQVAEGLGAVGELDELGVEQLRCLFGAVVLEDVVLIGGEVGRVCRA